MHLRTDSINETVLCGLVNELPNGIDFLISNDIGLKAHPLPDKVAEQAVITCSTARKSHKTSGKTIQCTSHNDHLITAVNAKTSTNSVTDYTKMWNNNVLIIHLFIVLITTRNCHQDIPLTSL